MNKTAMIFGAIVMMIVTMICVIIIGSVNNYKAEFMNNAMNGYYSEISVGK